MSKLKFITAPLALAAAVAFSSVAMAEETGEQKTPAVEIDRIGNAKTMATCTADSFTAMFKSLADQTETKVAPEDVKIFVEQRMFEILEECAVAATGLPDDQVPDMPELPAPDATEAEIMEFMAKAESFMKFLDTYIDEPTFNAAFATKMEAVLADMMKQIEQEEQKEDLQTKPKQEPAPAPKL